MTTPHDDRRNYAELEAKIESLKIDLKEMREDITGLIEAWNTARGITSFVKWLSGLIVSGGILYTLIRGIPK